MSLFWTVLTVALIVIEASTPQLVSIWLAGGAFASLIVSVCGGSLLWQILVFIFVSAVLLILTRPLVKKMRLRTDVKTNTDAIIGKDVLVTEDISNINSVGAVKIGGVTWSARSVDGSDIEKGKVVTVTSIEGVKVFVKIKED